MLHTRRYALLIVCLVLPHTLVAQDDVSEGSSVAEEAEPRPSFLPTQEQIDQSGSRRESADSTSNSESMLNVIIFLAIFVVGAYAVYRFLKNRKFRGPGGISGDSVVVREIASSALSPTKSVRLLDLESRILVVGVTDHAINTLAVIEDHEEMARLRLEASRENKAVVQTGFAASLKDMFAKRPSGVVASPMLGRATFSSLGSRLKKFSKPK